MATPFTPQQQRAIADPGSVVLAAGAGSGKTRVLVERYLRLLEHHAPAQLVAITFTDRAAREMRSRIRAGLKQRRTDHPDEPRWAAAEATLQSAVIDTIHGFGTRLLRKHGSVIGIDPAFRVQDELLTATIRDDAIETELHSILLGHGPLTRDLQELVVLHGWTAVAGAVTTMQHAPDVEAWTRFAGTPPLAVAKQWTAYAGGAFQQRFARHLLDQAPAIAALNTMTPATAEGLGLLTAVRQQVALMTTDPAQVQWDALPELLNLRVHAKLKKQFGAENYEILSPAFKALRGVADTLQAIAAIPEPAMLETAALAGQRLARLALAVQGAYAAKKHEAAVLDFQDLLTLSRNLLRDHPAVRQQVQKQYKALLLDELQDTDPVQMDLVNLVLGEAKWTGGLFAVGDAKQSIYRFRGADVTLFEGLRNDAPEQSRQELTVNFRSRPGVLHFVNALCRAWFPAESELVPHREAADCQATHFRGGSDLVGQASEPVPQAHQAGSSAAEIPAFAAESRVRGNVGDRLRGLSHHSASSENSEVAGRTIQGAEPCVELLLTLPPREKMSAEELRTLDAQAIAKRILEFTSGDTPFCKREGIVLLFRALTDVAIYETALRDAGINYYLVGGRAFFAQQEVHDLFNLLSALENPFDSLALAGALRSPFCGLSDEALHAVAFGAESVWEGLQDVTRRAALTHDDVESVARAVRFLTAWRSLKDSLPIARLLQRILDDSGYDAALLYEPLGERKLANLWKLQDIARQFDASGASHAEFVLRLGDLVTNQPREEQAATLPEEAEHVVKIMSIHQAKGLEFPVVFLPDLSRGENNRDDGVLRWHRDLCSVLPRGPTDMTDEEKEAGDPFSEWPRTLGRHSDALADAAESRRVFYVACTRAEEKLILTAALAKDKEPVVAEGPALEDLARVFDLTTGECTIPGGPRIVVNMVRPGAR